MDIDDLKGLDEETKKEIEELQKVTREKDGDEAYALAQFNMGKKFEEIGIVENDPCRQIRTVKLGRFESSSLTIIVKPHLSWRLIA
ncbi:hypothetical protein [Psychrobacter glacincola]|uniref:hypothetical protein n=1 Tax=Psychrobacter glacincola TaxID=56810 RepID=UPI0039AF016A